MMRKFLCTVLVIVILMGSTLAVKAEEYYIDVILSKYDGISLSFDLTVSTNCPIYYFETYYPDGSKRGLTTMFPGNMYEIKTYCDMSSYNDYDGEYLLVFYYEDCKTEVVFTIENSEQYRAWSDKITDNANSSTNNNANTGNRNNGTNRVTAIMVAETEIMMYPKEKREVTVTSGKSITVEVEDIDVIGATYLDGILTISALKAGNSEIWLKTSDNYINISVQVMNDTATGASTWAKEDIRKAITDGFVPEKIKENWTRSITREEFVEIAVLFLGLKPMYSNSPFLDTTNPYVTSAYESGIVTGMGDGKFNPKGKITRQEAAVMLMRVAKFSEVEIDAENVNFEDSEYIALWAKSAVAWAKSADIMHGDEKGNFNPTDEYTCEQAITTFVRLQEQMCN